MEIVFIILSVLTAYLIGSIPTGYILTKLFMKQDIRSMGSSNVGATNVFRVAGKLPGIVTLTVDVLKGIIAVTVVYDYYLFFLPSIDPDFFRALLGLVAICGHMWTVFLRFKGGKGVATTIGVLIILAPAILWMSILIWLIAFSLTNYVSFASLLFCLFLPIFACIKGESIYIVLFNVTICAILTYKHKDNINRLVKGVESKTYIFKNKNSIK